MLYTVFCDESCHLQKDNSSVMVLGAMYCLSEKRKQIYSDIRAIKEKNGLNSHFEIKWTKVSESKIEFIWNCWIIFGQIVIYIIVDW